MRPGHYLHTCSGREGTACPLAVWLRVQGAYHTPRVAASVLMYRVNAAAAERP